MKIRKRPRRNRKSIAIRDSVAETKLNAASFVMPIFIQESSLNSEIAAMPGCFRFGPEGLLKEVDELLGLEISKVVLFPAISDDLKTSDARECFNEEGLVPRSIRALKSRFPELVVITDVALDPYSSDGHDGLVSSSGEILNDETVDILCKQALTHASAGADIIAPSDMMDGRIGKIRDALDSESFSGVSLMAYTAKYASALYGPFRGALDSAPKFGDKKTYQMNPSNVREAIREAKLDEEEGADFLMVKPASFYLDVIEALRRNSLLPIAAYQVSGEYLMIKSAASTGWLDENSLILESLLSIHRAGADVILSYFSKEASKLLGQR